MRSRIAIATLALLLGAGAVAIGLSACGGEDDPVTEAPPTDGEPSADDPGPRPLPGPSAIDAWGELGPSPLRRTEVAAARIGRHAYVIGGFVPEGGATGRVVRYDILRDRWEEVEPLPIAVHHAVAAALEGSLYVHGGVRTDAGAAAPTVRLYRYDAERDRWQRLADSRTPRSAHALEPLAGELYAAGGSGPDGDLSSLEIYDPVSDSWREGPPMGTPRNHVAAAVLDRRLYVLGGRVERTNLSVAERYDLQQEAWSEVAPLRTARSGFAAVASRGEVVAFGGEQLAEGDRTIAEVERYDPDTDAWRPLPPMATARHGLGGVVFRGRVLSLEGGPTPGLDYSAANEYLDLP